jgi:hypothetical protein
MGVFILRPFNTTLPKLFQKPIPCNHICSNPRQFWVAKGKFMNSDFIKALQNKKPHNRYGVLKKLE